MYFILHFIKNMLAILCCSGMEYLIKSRVRSIDDIGGIVFRVFSVKLCEIQTVYNYNQIYTERIGHN